MLFFNNFLCGCAIRCYYFQKINAIIQAVYFDYRLTVQGRSSLDKNGFSLDVVKHHIRYVFPCLYHYFVGCRIGVYGNVFILNADDIHMSCVGCVVWLHSPRVQQRGVVEQRDINIAAAGCSMQRSGAVEPHDPAETSSQKDIAIRIDNRAAIVAHESQIIIRGIKQFHGKWKATHIH